MRPNRIAFVILCTILSGCQKHIKVPPQPPPTLSPVVGTTIAPALDTTPPPKLPPSPAAALLERANRAFAEGKYRDAADRYEEYVNTTSADGRDQALFKWGLSFALQTPPDWQHASGPFKKLENEFPYSPFTAEASLMRDLHSKIVMLQMEAASLQTSLDQATADKQQRDQRIKQLTSELDKLKRIDAERRKRP